MSKEMEDLFTVMKENWAKFEADHVEAVTKENAAAARRARKAIQEIRKAITGYRKASVEAFKKK